MNVMLRQVQISRWQLGSSRFNPLPQARLSEGRMSAPSVSPAAMSVLQKAGDRIVETLAREIQAVQEEYNLASPAAIRVDPTSAREIRSIGALSPQEIRSALSAAARELGGISDRVLSGALSHYLTSDQLGTLQGLKAQAGQLVTALENQDMTPITGSGQGAVQDYLSGHLAEAQSLVQAAEKAVVVAEAGAVPVLEPSEKGFSKLQIAAGAGIVVGLGVLLWSIL